MNLEPTLRKLSALILVLPFVISARAASAAPSGYDEGPHKLTTKTFSILAKDSEGGKSDASRKRIGVGDIDGPGGDDARQWVIQSLKEGGDYDVVDAAGVKTGGDDQAYADAGKKLGVDAIIVGEVSKKYNLKLIVQTSENGASVGEVEVKGGSGPKLKKAVENELGIAIADPLSKVKAGAVAPAAAAEEKPAEEAKPEAEEPEKPAPEEPSGGDKRPSPLEATLGIRAFNRNFSYKDPIQDFRPNDNFYPLYSYNLPLGPAIFIDARVYPLAFLTGGVPAHIGIELHFEQGFGTKSVYAENTPDELTLTTNVQEFRVGLRGRIPIDTHEIGIFAQYGIHKFILTGDEDGPLVPDVTYGYIRPGVDARFRFGDFSVGAHVAPRIMLSYGELAAEGIWFPGVKGHGLDAGLELGYGITPMIHILTGFDFLQYGFDFNAIPDDNAGIVAGGATDRYLSGYLGVGIWLPGSDAGSGSPGSASLSVGGD